MTVPKLCECGCGQPTRVATQTDRRRGLVRGQPTRFRQGHGGVAKPHSVYEVGGPSELYAEELLNYSALLIGAVHDDGPDMLRAHLSAALRVEPPAGVDPVEALVTVLAAQIDPETTAEQRLGWVRRFGRPPVARKVPGPSPDRAASIPTPPEETAA